MSRSHLLNLRNNGFTVINVPRYIKKNFEDSIFEILKEKNLLKKKSSFKEASKKIQNLNEKEFINNFGHVAFRYLKFKHSSNFNNWVQKVIKKYLNSKNASLHYSCIFDKRVNKKINSKQYCVYLRCVRPNIGKDIGRAHRDKDFWKLIKKKEIPKAPFKYTKLYKIWVPIFGCNNKNSLHFYKSSNLNTEMKTIYYKKNKRKKPYYKNDFLKKIKRTIVQPLKNFDKEANLFSDNVLHFAPENKNSKKIRLSVEATIVTN